MIFIKTVIANLNLSLVMMRGELQETSYNISVKLIDVYIEVGNKLKALNK